MFVPRSFMAGVGLMERFFSGSVAFSWGFDRDCWDVAFAGLRNWVFLEDWAVDLEDAAFGVALALGAGLGRRRSPSLPCGITAALRALRLKVGAVETGLPGIGGGLDRINPGISFFHNPFHDMEPV